MFLTLENLAFLITHTQTFSGGEYFRNGLPLPGAVAGNTLWWSSIGGVVGWVVGVTLATHALLHLQMLLERERKTFATTVGLFKTLWAPFTYNIYAQSLHKCIRIYIWL